MSSRSILGGKISANQIQIRFWLVMGTVGGRVGVAKVCGWGISSFSLDVLYGSFECVTYPPPLSTRKKSEMKRFVECGYDSDVLLYVFRSRDEFCVQGLACYQLLFMEHRVDL